MIYASAIIQRVIKADGQNAQWEEVVGVEMQNWETPLRHLHFVSRRAATSNAFLWASLANTAALSAFQTTSRIDLHSPSHSHSEMGTVGCGYLFSNVHLNVTIQFRQLLVIACMLPGPFVLSP